MLDLCTTLALIERSGIPLTKKELEREERKEFIKLRDWVEEELKILADKIEIDYPDCTVLTLVQKRERNSVVQRHNEAANILRNLEQVKKIKEVKQWD